MGIFERYSENARRTAVRAKHEADRFGSLAVGTEHILLALLTDSDLISSTMQAIPVAEIRDAVEARIPRLEVNPLPHDLALNSEGRTVLLLATENAGKLGHTHVQNEHVLLALVQSENSYAAQLLRQRGLSADKLQLQINALAETKQVQETTRTSRQITAEESKFLETIRRVGELVSSGEGQKALQLLDDFMAEPGEDRQHLLHFAAVTALQIGDLKAVRRFCEERLRHKPGDAMALYSLADCLARLGETDEARRRAAECLRAASSRGDERGKRIVELVENRFPELKRGPAKL